MTKKLPNSLRKYIRKEKARIRRECRAAQEAEQKIAELLKRFAAAKEKASLPNA